MCKMPLVECIWDCFGVFQPYLAICGLFYLSKLLFAIIVDLKAFFKTYMQPKISKYKPNFLIRYGKWAIVTGCTQGIGKCYADELAKRGMSLVLISRNKDKLEKLAEEIHLKYKGNPRRDRYNRNKILLYLIY